MLAYVHIEYSTYQFSEESKSLRYRKKRGPERVNRTSNTYLSLENIHVKILKTWLNPPEELFEHYIMNMSFFKASQLITDFILDKN